MKEGKSNKTGKVIGTILMVIGAGSIIGFFSSQRNRINSRKKALEIGNYLLGKVQHEKKEIGKKTRELISKTKDVDKDIVGLLSNFEKKTT